MPAKTRVIKRLLEPVDDTVTAARQLELDRRIADMRTSRLEGLGEQLDVMDEYVALGGPQVSHDQWTKMMREDPDGTAAALANRNQHIPRVESSRHVDVSSLEAEARLANGEHPATVFRETGWYRVPDGPKDRRMRFYLPDAHARINSDVLRQSAEVGRLKDGETRAFHFRVGEVLDHPDLYEAYPELMDTPIAFHVTRTGDEYKVFNPNEPFVKGDVSHRGPRSAITIYNDANADIGRNTLLHEINHVVQRIEGWSGGSSVQQWEDLMNTTETFLHDQRMVDDVLNNRVDLDSLQDMARYSDEYTQKYGADSAMVDKQLFEMGMVPNLAEYQEALGPVLDRQIRDMGLFLRQVGANEDIEGMLRATTPAMRTRLAQSRYLRQLGEAESRVREALSDMTMEELRSMKGTPIEALEPLEGLKKEDLIP